MTSGDEKATRMAIRRANGTRKLPKAQQFETHPSSGYLIAHACFNCQQSWKMKPRETGHVCPECGQAVCIVGRSFKAPKKANGEQWEKVKRLWEAGFRFDSYRTFPDAEVLPEYLSEVEDFISRNPHHPFRTSQL
jgi:predicted RNA-binding Zn-ribbon protein involved in translation (DUF1610 family)